MKSKDCEEMLNSARELIILNKISAKCIKRFLLKEGINVSNQQIEVF